MTRSGAVLVSIFVVGTCLAAQEAPPPAFEVAAINQVPYSDDVRDEILVGRRRAIMTITDSRVAISYLSLGEIVRRAFAVERYEMSGPDWLEELRFDIQGTLPQGGRRDQVPAMLRALLAQRFDMVTHTESREVPAYALVVSQKGHRLEEAALETDAAPVEKPPSTGATGPPGPSKPFTMTMKTENNGTMTFRAGPNGTIEAFVPKMTMSELSRTLTGMLGRPVFDRTGLTGAYQFTLSVAMDDVARLSGLTPGSLPPAPASPAASASEPAAWSSVVGSVERLGLMLESRRMPINVVVVDKMSRTPTPN